MLWVMPSDTHRLSLTQRWSSAPPTISNPVGVRKFHLNSSISSGLLWKLNEWQKQVRFSIVVSNLPPSAMLNVQDVRLKGEGIQTRLRFSLNVWWQTLKNLGRYLKFVYQGLRLRKNMRVLCQALQFENESVHTKMLELSSSHSRKIPDCSFSEVRINLNVIKWRYTSTGWKRAVNICW